MNTSTVLWRVQDRGKGRGQGSSAGGHPNVNVGKWRELSVRKRQRRATQTRGTALSPRPHGHPPQRASSKAAPKFYLGHGLLALLLGPVAATGFQDWPPPIPNGRAGGRAVVRGESLDVMFTPPGRSLLERALPSRLCHSISRYTFRGTQH